MNEALVDMWNKDVKEEDTVFFLGDFSLNFNITLEVLPYLNGAIINLIPGNHDKWHVMHRGHVQTNKKLANLKTKSRIVLCDPVEELTIGKVKLLLCHFPWAGDPDPHSDEHNKYDDRFKEWRPSREEFPHHWLVSGHRHTKPENRVGNRLIDVGFDPWGRMVNLEEILRIIDNGNIV